MSNYRTNILILGKTGVGKSSLLNYVLGSDVAATASGKPVTGEGIFRYPPIVHGRMEIVVHDSWGLEPDKAGKWKSIIEAEVRKNNSQQVKDWFHTIIYCVDCKRARIEEFERKEILQPLVESGNRLIFALTKADIASDQEKRDTSRVLKESWPDFMQVETCSVSKKLRNGECKSPFGRDRLLAQLCRNLGENLLGKALESFRQTCFDGFDATLPPTMDYFSKLAGPLGFFTFYNEEFQQKIHKFLRKKLDDILSAQIKQLETNLGEINVMLRYWKDIADFAVENVQTLKFIDLKPKNLEDYQNFDNSTASTIAEAIVIVIFGPLSLFLRKGLRKDDIKNFCDDTIQIVKNNLDSAIKKMQMDIYKSQNIDMPAIRKSIMTNILALPYTQK